MYSSATQLLSNVLTHLLLPPSFSSLSSSSDSPLYSDDAYPSTSSSSSSPFTSAPSPLTLRLTTDLLASSIRSSIRTFNPTSPTKSDCRVLVLGTHAQQRALHLTQAKDFPERAYALHAEKGEGWGGIFWCDDVQGLQGVRPASFDAALCFNVREVVDAGQAVELLSRLLKPAGAIAGTGLFAHSADAQHSAATSSSSSSSSPSSSSGSYTSPSWCSPSPLSLMEFRERVEGLGFFMHTAVDLSMEGSLSLHVLDDARSACHEADPVHADKLIAGRFLATKRASRRPPSPLTVHTHPTSPPPLPFSPLSTQQSSVETQLWSLSMSLSNSLASPFPSHLRSTSGSSTCSSPIYPPIDPIVVTGVSLGLPNALYPDRSIFSPDNFSAIFRGDNFISTLSPALKQRILAQNVCQVYKKDGQRIKYRLQHDKEVIQVAALLRPFDLAAEYPYIPAHVVEVLDTTYALAIAAGLEALKDAGIDVLTEKVVGGETVSVIGGLPEHMRDDTGVIFASSFPCLDSLTEEVTKSAAAKARKELRDSQAVEGVGEDEYEYDRKLLFKLLVMANSQLAELIKARGPNTHLNNACSGTTQAIAVAEDWIKVGRCKRVVVISADHATSEQLLPYLATGFLALGAATTVRDVCEAAVPFDLRRKGMILGAGAIGMVMESASACGGRVQPKVEVLGTCISNSAFHASLMDATTTSHQLNRFIARMEELHHLDRHQLAKDLIYFSHETSTHSNGGCAKVEMDALHAAFHHSKPRILLANTKGFTGHPMGVGMEDVIAVQSLHLGLVPPIANHKVHDPALGLEASQLPVQGETRHERRFVLRFAAGFGSQFAYVLYRKWEERGAGETEEGEGSGHSTPTSPSSDSRT